MKRFLRYLRIAFSATCLIACILLIALWVRSEHHFDVIGSIMSAQGRLYHFPKVNLLPAADGGAAIETYDHFHGAVKTIVARNVQVTPAPGAGPTIPIWAPVLIVTLFAITPWLPQRFSLRTLLIAMALVAVVLGLIAWAVR
jgi:hypothetical protein